MTSVFAGTERTTSRYTATIEDADGNALPLASIGTVTLTLTDVDTETVINNRDDQDVKNANNVTIHVTSGLLTWEVQSADMPIVTNGRKTEMHRAVFDVAYSASKRLVHEFYILVNAVEGVP